MTRVLLVALCAILVGGGVPLLSRTATAAPRATSLTVVYTNNTDGTLKPCNCPGAPFGGLARRATVIDSLREAHPNALVVDSGDLLPTRPGTDTEDVILEAYEYMRYDAVAVGDQEVLGGTPHFVELTAGMTVPFLAANLQFVGASGPVPLGRPYLLKTYGNLTVAVIGIITAEALDRFGVMKEQSLEPLDPVQKLRELLESLRDRADLFVVLSHAGDEFDALLAQQVPGIDVIVGGHSQRLIREPLKVGGTLIVQAGTLAKHVGVLTLDLSGGRIVSVQNSIVDLSPKVRDDPHVQQLVDAYSSKRDARGKAPAEVKRRAASQPSATRVPLRVYYVEGCDECQEIREVFLPRLAAEMGISLKIIHLNIDSLDVYEELYETEQRLNDTDNEVPVVVLGDRIFGGLEEIKSGLEGAIREFIEQDIRGSARQKREDAGSR